MKVLYVANCRLPTERAHGIQIMETAAAMVRAGLEVVLAVPDRYSTVTGDPFAYYGISERFPIVRVPVIDKPEWARRRGRFAFWITEKTFLWSVRRYARRTRPDIIFSRDPYAARMLARARHKVFFEMHDPAGSRRLYRDLFRRVAGVVTTNQNKKDEIVSAFGVPAARVLVAPNGFDPARFHPMLGTEATGPTVVYTGHLFGWKGTDTLVAAARVMPDVQFILVGGTSNDQERLRPSLPSNVRLVPHVPHIEVPSYLAAARVLVLPNSAKEDISRTATSPIKLFEYLATGRPIVASDLPSIREIVDERIVVLVKPDDSTALAEGIRRALAEPGNAEERKRIAQSFTWDARARSIGAFLSQIPAGDPCPLCGTSGAEVIFRKATLDRDVTNVICKKCALVFISPRPEKTAAAEFHQDGFLGYKNQTDASVVVPKLKTSDLVVKKGVVEFLREFLRPGANVVDVGCGFGTLLHLLKERASINAVGVEVGNLDIKVAKEYYGLDVFRGTLEDFSAARENAGKFDLVIMNHVLEHLPEPRESLGHVRKILKSDGLLYVGVPNIMNIKKRPEDFFQIFHALNFSPYSLKALLEASGFGIVSFNVNASLPGGMETVARLDSRGISSDALASGNRWQDVAAYVARTERKYRLLRRARDLGLFFVPRALRIKMGRIVYMFLKRRRA